MNIPAHPMPPSTEACLRLMRAALTIAAERERRPQPNFADAFGGVAVVALDAAIECDTKAGA